MDQPQTARIRNYWLGGTDNFPVDRQVGDQIRAAFPDLVDNARASRAFLVRAVSHVTAEAGLRRFLDVGTGLPTADNTSCVVTPSSPASSTGSNRSNPASRRPRCGVRRIRRPGRST